MGKVLLTGGSGFIAAHILDILLKHGHQVVFTVRTPSKGDSLLKSHPNLPPSTLSYVIVEDIAADDAFSQAVVSNPPFSAVIHTASPFFHPHPNSPLDPVRDFLDPAIKGTTGILKAIRAYAPSVHHVVITSSMAAMLHATNGPAIYTEHSWNPVTMDEALTQPATAYRASKTFAERAAWHFLRDEAPHFEMTTLCPPLVIGPIIHPLDSLDAINTSNIRTRDLILGKYRDAALPATGVWAWVDVRDIALAHVLAIEKPEKAKGKRIFVVEGHFSNKRLAECIGETHAELRERLPGRGEAVDDTPVGVYGVDNGRSKDVLGLEYRGLKECVKDMVDSIIRVGGLK